MQQLKSVEPPPIDFGTGSMFDHIAGRYDLINRVMALNMDVGWRKEMIHRLREKLSVAHESSSSIRLLDVATGTADVAVQLAKNIPSSTILGLDPSENMLHYGRHKIEKHSLSNRVLLETADARDLSKYSDQANSFDGATMAFGIRNIPEREIALCEIHQMLKPSGVLAILEFSEPDDTHGIPGKMARIFIRHVIPLVGGVLSGKPREYMHLQNSIRQFPSPPQFRQLLETLSCGSDQLGYFHMEEVMHMNFGSVQLYIGTAEKRLPEFE